MNHKYIGSNLMALHTSVAEQSQRRLWSIQPPVPSRRTSSHMHTETNSLRSVPVWEPMERPSAMCKVIINLRDFKSKV